MQRIDPLDPQNKSLFKKRVHRPWDPGTLDNAHLTEVVIEPPKTPIGQLLVGGFLNIQNNSSQWANVDLLNDLKPDKAVEYAKQLYLAKQKEELARKAAENKMLFALQQAKIAAEKIQKSEHELLNERQLRSNKEIEIANTLKLLQEKEEAQTKSREKLRELEIKIQESNILFEQEVQALLDKKSAQLSVENAEMQSKIEMDAREKIHAAEMKFQTLERTFFDSKAELNAINYNQLSSILTNN